MNESFNVSQKRVAVVGTGYFCQFHLDGWRNVKNTQVVALCDNDIAKAQTLAKQYGITQTFSNAAEMLDAVKPDLVDIVVPPAAQDPLIRACIERQTATICQKPFSTGLAQATELAQLAEQSKVPLIIHENFRFMPWYREARQLINSNALGDLHGVSFRLRPGDGQGPTAYLDRQPYFQTMPRLLVVETAIHFIDTFRYLMGEVTHVYARLRKINPVIKGEDAGLIIFEFASGAQGLFDGNRLNDHSASNPRRTMGEMWLEGSKGVLRLDGDAQLWFKPHHEKEVRHIYASGDLTTFGGGACAALQQSAITAITHHTEPENSATAYLRNVKIQEAIYTSHAQGQRVAIDSLD